MSIQLRMNSSVKIKGGQRVDDKDLNSKIQMEYNLRSFLEDKENLKEKAKAYFHNDVLNKEGMELAVNKTVCY